MSDSSHVGVARRHAVALAEAAGFGATETGRVALVATELANNLVNHGGGGRLFLQLVANGEAPEIEVLSVDKGPGMNVQESLRDGFSSGGTAGQGLGAIKRLSVDFEIYSRPGAGTVTMARVVGTLDRLQTTTRSRWRWGSLTTPAPGEIAIGDKWALRTHGNDLYAMVADGLGHGPMACEAAEAATREFEDGGFGEIELFMGKAHSALRSTRGAAVAAARCPGASDAMEYLSVGNIAATIIARDGSMKRLMSHNGTVGAEMRSTKTLSYPWRAGDRLVMHSDGLTARWSLAEYPQITDYHPAILAALLFRDHVRGRDDATILVLERPN